MSPQEQDRDDIRRALGDVVGPEIADRIMENLPPFPWHDVARQLAHSRVMFFSMLGAVFTSASLALAAVRF